MDNNILIDGLEYVNWNRDLFEKAHAGGLTAIHATLVYWEDTKESFEKMDYWDNLILSNSDILVHVKKSSDILKAKQANKIGIIYGFQNSAPIANDIFLVEKFFNKVFVLCNSHTTIKPLWREDVMRNMTQVYQGSARWLLKR